MSDQTRNGGRPVQVVRTVRDLRDALAQRRAEAPQRDRVDTVDAVTVGLVPTMGALHDGHLSLIRLARTQCDVVVMSLFVNPSQFNESADLEHYPRSEERDEALAREAGVDLVFAPSVEEMYPAGFSTSVEVIGLTDRLEGVVRGASHFRGVTTVVTKLLTIVRPDIAYFGQKDAQQLLVIRRLVADLNLEVKIVAGRTVRDPDGLAMSSRNARLSPSERTRARSLSAGLAAAARLLEEGERSGAALVEAARAEMLAAHVEPEYVALVDTHTLEPCEVVTGVALLALAGRVGEVRLIDNTLLRAPVAIQPKPLTQEVTA